MGQRVARLAQQLARLGQRQAQRDGQRQCGGLAGLVVGGAADLGEQLAVEVCALVALGVGHALFVDLAQQHLGEALVQLAQRVLQRGHGGGPGRGTVLHGLRRRGHRLPLRAGAAVVMERGVVVVDVLADVGIQAAARQEAGLVKQHEQHEHVLLGLIQKLADGVHRDAEGLILGIAVGSGGDQREGEAFEAVLRGQAQAVGVAGRQQLTLPCQAAVPDGAHGVDDIAAGQAIAAGQLGLARLAAAQRAAFGQQPRPGRAVDGAVHTAAAQQRGPGRVDDGVYGKAGDVVPDDLNGHGVPSLMLVVPV